MNLIWLKKFQKLKKTFKKFHNFFLKVFFEKEFKIKLVQNFCPIWNLHHFILVYNLIVKVVVKTLNNN